MEAEIKPSESKGWKSVLAEHQKSHALRASWQIFNSIGSYIGVWVLIYFALKISVWLVLPLIVLAAGLLLRVFIIFHDCGHGSFFKSRRANDTWGFIAGVLALTPYYQWRAEHWIHHGSSGNLDQRGIGDIWTLTVQEYLASTRWRRFAYRLARNPIVLFVLAPVFLFIFRHRYPTFVGGKRERHSVWWLNLALLIVAIGMSSLYGFVPYILIQSAVMALAGTAGIWMFYVQHQYEDVYWERDENWDLVAAAIQGSSFYKLPRILQWFTGNIGFHHIHHLNPRIPNYNLEKCHKADPLFHEVKPLTLLSSLKSLRHRLWDEASKKLVGYSHLKTLRKNQMQ